MWPNLGVVPVAAAVPQGRVAGGTPFLAGSELLHTSLTTGAAFPGRQHPES